MGHPGDTTEEDWEKYLNDMIFTFHEIVYQNKNLQKYDEEEYWKRYNEGKKFFSKYFLDLWD